MLVPKTSVNQYDLLVTGEHQVGSTWQVTAMQAETVSEPMANTSYHHFRPGILATDTGHDVTTLLLSKIVHGRDES